jgi:hypothetical protein
VKQTKLAASQASPTDSNWKKEVKLFAIKCANVIENVFFYMADNPRKSIVWGVIVTVLLLAAMS